jgi:hypothetical protein
MITRDGVDLASNVDNNSTFVDTINIFKIDSFGLKLSVDVGVSLGDVLNK